jgi:hypothetical protein
VPPLAAWPAGATLAICIWPALLHQWIEEVIGVRRASTAQTSCSRAVARSLAFETGLSSASAVSTQQSAIQTIRSHGTLGQLALESLALGALESFYGILNRSTTFSRKCIYICRR